jgi:hypothetical protein
MTSGARLCSSRMFQYWQFVDFGIW